MVNGLLARLENVTLKRVNVAFVVCRRGHRPMCAPSSHVHTAAQHKKKNLDSFIGRTAHIYFLDQAVYMHMLLSVYGEYLR